MTRRGDDRSDAEALDRWWDECEHAIPIPGSAERDQIGRDIAHLSALDRALTPDDTFLDRLGGRLLGGRELQRRSGPRGSDDAWSEPTGGVPPRTGMARLGSGVGLVATLCLVVITFGGVGVMAWILADWDDGEDRNDRPAVAASPDGDHAVEIAECLVGPPTKDSIGSIRATPEAAPALPFPVMGEYGPTDVTLPTGPAADAETLAGIEATLRLLTACRYHDREPFVLGWVRGEPAGRYFGLFTPAYFRTGQPGGFFDVSIPGRDSRHWRPQDATPPAIGGAVVLPDGRFAALIEDDGGPGTLALKLVMVLRKVDGRWLVDGIFNRTRPVDRIPGTPVDRPIAVMEFRQEGISLDLIRYSLNAGQPNLFVLVNAGDVPRRLAVPDLGIDVMVPPLGQVEVEIDGPVGDHLVVTYTGDDPDPPLLVPCGGAQVNGGTLRIFPAGVVAVNPCAG